MKSNTSKTAPNSLLPEHLYSIRNSIVMKYSFRKYLKIGLALILPLFASSCLQTETNVNLNKDGSGTIVEQTILGDQMLAMMTQFAQPGDPDPIQEMFSEEKSKAKIPKMGEGVEFVKVEMINEGGKKGGRVHYKFADINKLNINPAGGLEAMNEEEGEEAVDPKKLLKFKYADGKLSLMMPPTKFDEMNMDMGDEENPQAEAMAKQMMGDMRMTLKLNFPGGIDKTNATHVEGNTATLEHFAKKKAL
ncbi:MAG: hypothetical protein ACK46A_10285 [Akkermansiaceae bacterium]